MKSDQLVQLLKATDALTKEQKKLGPQTDDELHAWIKENLGMDIPRKPICPGHQSPFEFLADIYFERVTSAIAVANRGGAKTMISAILHLLNSLFKPNCESATVGAVEQQSQRAYGNLKFLLKSHGKVDIETDHPEIVRSVQRETLFKNGAIVEVLIGTKAGVNGPHPQKVHADEVELMDEEVFQESRNMSQSKNGIRAQDWITSTRKRAHGPMQKLIDENFEAERAGAEAPYKLYTWCIFESAAKVDNCIVAYPDHPAPCNCQLVVKGTWDDGTPRRFSEVCKGRLAKSEGFVPLHDVHKTFRNTNQETYEAQQLCAKPETAGLVFPWFATSSHGIKWFVPDPDNGPIYQSVDFGGGNPHAVNWYQILEVETKAHGFYQTKDEEPQMVLPIGSRICFDEIYKSQIGNTELADLVVAREALWKRDFPSFHVTMRFADPAALSARLDWASHAPPLRTAWFATRDIKEQIKVVRALVRDRTMFVDTIRCPMWVEEAESYHYPKKRSGMIDDPEIPVDDFNHCMSNFRYCMMNVHVIERKTGRSGGNTGVTLPAASKHQHQSSPKSGVARYMPREGDTVRDLHPLAGRKFE